MEREKQEIWWVCKVDTEMYHLDSLSRKDLLPNCSSFRVSLSYKELLCPKANPSWDVHIHWLSQASYKAPATLAQYGILWWTIPSPDLTIGLAEVLSDLHHSMMSFSTLFCSSIFYLQILTLNKYLVPQSLHQCLLPENQTCGVIFAWLTGDMWARN